VGVSRQLERRQIRWAEVAQDHPNSCSEALCPISVVASGGGVKEGRAQVESRPGGRSQATNLRRTGSTI